MSRISFLYYSERRRGGGGGERWVLLSHLFFFWEMILFGIKQSKCHSFWEFLRNLDTMRHAKNNIYVNVKIDYRKRIHSITHFLLKLATSSLFPIPSLCWCHSPARLLWKAKSGKAIIDTKWFIMLNYSPHDHRSLFSVKSIKAGNHYSVWSHFLKTRD